MTIAAAFADIALGFSAATGAGYHPAIARWPGKPVAESGGSIAIPGTPITKSCHAQVDAATEAMRASEGFVDGDVRLLILAATLDMDMDTDATVEITKGPHRGKWMVGSVERDPAGVYWACRGRRA